MRCTKIPTDAKICFLDDQEHPSMEHDMVYYINIKPYTHDLPYELMVQRFIDSNIPCAKRVSNPNILRTMAYTDHVIGKLIDDNKDKTWFENTIFQNASKKVHEDKVIFARTYYYYCNKLQS